MFVCCLMMATGAQGRPFMPGDAKVEIISYRQLGAGDDFPGMWEYVYDVIATTDAGGNNHAFVMNFGLTGFDSSLMANRWTDAGDLWDGTGNAWDYEPKQNWCANSAGVPRSFGGAIYFDRWPSYWGVIPGTEPFNFSAWHEPKDVHPLNYNAYDIVYDSNPGAVNQAWYTDNPWHGGDEYVHGDSMWAVAETGRTSQVMVDPDGIPDSGDEYLETVFDPDGIHFSNQRNAMTYYGLTGLLSTFRVVHPNAPAEVEWYTYNNSTAGSLEEVQGTIVGPDPIPEPATMSLLAIGGLAVLRRRRK